MGKIEIGTDAPASRCKACNRWIYWITNVTTGKTSPYDKDGTSHFATCPMADRFRSKKKIAS